MNSGERNNKNLENVRTQIIYKLNYNNPYYGGINPASSIVTDMDNFPYNRYFRGRHNCSNPIVFEREAGFRPLETKCYRTRCNITHVKPNYCFQFAPSTTIPCNLRDVVKTGRKSFVDLLNVNGCVPESP